MHYYLLFFQLLIVSLLGFSFQAYLGILFCNISFSICIQIDLRTLLFVSFVINEGLFAKLPIFVVADDHSLCFVGYSALIANVGPREWVVSRDHHDPNLSLS